MSLQDWPDDPEKFIIRSTDPQKQNLGFLCYCAPPSSEDSSGGIGSNTPPKRQDWFDAINTLLKKQENFLYALQSPIAYQKELTKDPL